MPSTHNHLLAILVECLRVCSVLIPRVLVKEGASCIQQMRWPGSLSMSAIQYTQMPSVSSASPSSSSFPQIVVLLCRRYFFELARRPPGGCTFPRPVH